MEQFVGFRTKFCSVNTWKGFSIGLLIYFQGQENGRVGFTQKQAISSKTCIKLIMINQLGKKLIGGYVFLHTSVEWITGTNKFKTAENGCREIFFCVME